jgi:hypothetical protein
VENHHPSSSREAGKQQWRRKLQPQPLKQPLLPMQQMQPRRLLLLRV